MDAIKRLAPPTTQKQLRLFTGLVNYYRDMWIRRSHVLAPLTELTSKNATGMATSGFLVEVELTILDDLRKRYPEKFK